MIVRPVTRADASRWLQMRQALWPDGATAEHRDEIEGFFAERSGEPQATLLAANSVGQVVGFAELSIRAYAEGCRSDRVAYLEGWYVAPGHRQSGVGRLLVRAAERWGREQGCCELASDTEIENTISHRAYLALGFEDVGVVRLFRKDLEPIAEESQDHADRRENPRR